MKIWGFTWPEIIVEKLHRKHEVEPFEVEEVFENLPHFRFVEKGHRQGEDLYSALGRTDAGRYLVVFFVYTKNHYAIIISARTMTKTERKRYERR